MSYHVQRQVHLLRTVPTKKELNNHLWRACHFGWRPRPQFVEINPRKSLKLSDLVLTLWQ